MEKEIMEYQITKLDVAPTKDESAPEGHTFVGLTYKTNKQGVKRPAVWYVVPDVYQQFTLEVEDSQKQVAAMLMTELERLQRERLYEFEDGELAAREWVLDVNALAERYFIDGRSLGVKQEELEEWINKILKPMMITRINKNMPNQPESKRLGLVNAVTDQFHIAVTRSNSLKGKFVTWTALNDLKQRLELYRDNGELEVNEEFTAMLNRINKHLGVDKVAADVVETF